mgnify:CR=1 FL=1
MPLGSLLPAVCGRWGKNPVAPLGPVLGPSSGVWRGFATPLR